MNEDNQNRRKIKSSSIKTRFTPTFYHHNIFDIPSQNYASTYARLTPTFQSTVFNCDGYLIQTHHSRTLKAKRQHKNDPEPHVYINQSRQKKQAFLNPCCNYAQSQSYKVNHNDEKIKLAEDINQLEGRTSRMRKCVELMSNSVFGGYIWTPVLTERNRQKQQLDYNPDKYRVVKQIVENKQLSLPKRQNVQQNSQFNQKIPLKNTQNNGNPINKKQMKSPVKDIIKSSTNHSKNLKKFKSAVNLHSKPSKKRND